jgi:hypothetical protein
MSNDEISLSIGFSLNVEHSEKIKNPKSGLLYHEKNNTLQIGETVPSLT